MRADDALFVVRVQRGGAFRINGAQLGEEDLAALVIPAPLQKPARLSAGRAGSVTVSAQERVEVQPRAADKNGQPSAREDAVHAFGGVRGVARHGVILARVDHADHVVRHAPRLSASVGAAVPMTMPR